MRWGGIYIFCKVKCVWCVGFGWGGDGMGWGGEGGGVVVWCGTGMRSPFPLYIKMMSP